VVKTPRSVRRASGAALSLALALALAGCEGAGAVVATSDEPFLYVALTPPSPARIEPGVHGLLLTVGSPVAATYRHAERFELRRSGDGEAFGWTHLGRTGERPRGAQTAQLREGNYFLPDTVGDGLLSARDIRPGERYDLYVETGGATIRGSVVVPDSFVIRYEVVGGERTIRWDPVPGAAAYIVWVQPYVAPTLQEANHFVLPDRTTAEFRATVHAVDPALYRYLADDRARRSGIDRGYGAFGAFTTATLTYTP
jgi:hypothetical protein